MEWEAAAAVKAGGEARDPEAEAVLVRAAVPVTVAPWLAVADRGEGRGVQAD